MPQAGDSFQTNTYQKWGERKPLGKRETDSRDEIQNESYIKVPQKAARDFCIFMSNQSGANTQYEAYDDNGNLICTLTAQGNVSKGAKYAKQLSGSGDLKSLTPWIRLNNITDSDTIEVEFTSPTDLILRKK